MLILRGVRRIKSGSWEIDVRSGLCSSTISMIPTMAGTLQLE